MLCAWIVCGIEDQKIQQRLLAEPELTFDKAFKFAPASESADKNAKDLQPAAKVPEDLVHNLQGKQPLSCYYAPIKVLPYLPPCGECGEIGGDLTYLKTDFPY